MPSQSGFVPHVGEVRVRILFGPTAECEVAAHELGHAFGLEHEFLCKDPMTYISGCGHKTFQDVAAWCGENKAKKCSDGGKQNTVQHLNEVLGLAKDDPN